MSLHINRFIDSIKAAESRGQKDFTMTMRDAKDLHADITKLLMTLAAMHTIDADKSNAEQVTATMKDPTTLSCLEAAQIEMFGCVSATATRYEHAFCLARYGLRLNGDKNRSIAGCVTTLAK